MGQKRTPVSDQQPALPIGNGRLDGIRTRITGLKDRHPVILEDEAENETRGRSLRLPPIKGAPRVLKRDRT